MHSKVYTFLLTWILMILGIFLPQACLYAQPQVNCQNNDHAQECTPQPSQAETVYIPAPASAPASKGEAPSLSKTGAIDNRKYVQGQPQPPANAIILNPPSFNTAQIENYLGWVNKNDAQNMCQGYYVEPNLYYSEDYHGEANKEKIHIAADNVEFSQTSVSILTGDVVLTQPNRRLDSDLAYVNRNPQTQKMQSVDLYGKVILREPGNLVMADKAHFNLEDKSGSLDDVLYRMAFGETVDEANINSSQVTIDELNGWGTAHKVKRLPDGVIEVYKGTYTACPPSQSAWKLKANYLNLNRDTGRGEATNAVLYLKDVPILYAPYFNFPLDNRRQTGFLYPTFQHSTLSGYEVGIPFYWNIAPNYDATITPDYMTERGLQMNGQFRYLTPNSNGEMHGSILPQDHEFSSFKKSTTADILSAPPITSEQSAELNRLNDASNDRYLVSLKDNRSYSSNWSSYLYLNHVSDDYYFEDFSSDPAQITENQILNEGDLYYNNDHWNFTGQLQGYQTLHPVNQSPVANQYKKLPELMLNGNYPAFYQNFNFAIQNQYDSFQINNNPGETTKPVNGQRLYTAPDLSLPKYWMWGYFKPDVQLTATQYDLHNQVPNEANSITRILPIIDVDSGLLFDRNGSWFSHPYQQTFEPRLFYLYVPYENQNDIPLFDTWIEPFSYAQLFRTNRYTGIDRIGDTNQVSLAATTRFINSETGDEKIRFSVGQIYYFEQRRVNLDETSLDLVTLDNQVPPKAYSSPIAGEADYHIAKNWDVVGDIAWNPNYLMTNNANLMFQYKEDNQHIVNVGYNFLRGGDAFTPSNGTTIPSNSSQNNLNQADFSLVWPIARQWQFVGRWNYNISHAYPQTYYGGLEYESCCWALRIVEGRSFDYLNNQNKPVFDNQIYVQLALKTLGNVGVNDPSGMLVSDIPGYVDTFGTVGQHSRNVNRP